MSARHAVLAATALAVAFVPLVLAQPFGKGRDPAPALPAALQFLAAKSVSDELKLTDKQREQVQTLTTKYEKALRNKSDKAKWADLFVEGDKEARGVLDAAQARRLAQIEFQAASSNARLAQMGTTGIADRRDPGLDRLLKDERIAAVLKPTEEQLKKVAALAATRRRAVLTIFTSDVHPDKIIEQIEAFEKETKQLLLAVLQPNQQVTLKELIGEPFTGTWPTLRRPEGGPPLRTVMLFVYLAGAPYLGSPDLHKELKVDAATAAKLTALAKQHQRSSFAIEKAGAQREVADAIRKEVATLLDASQMKRFTGVYLGFVADQSAGNSGSKRTIHNYEEVRTGLKLTAEQITKLTLGSPIASVLDETQAKAWKDLRGEPFTGRLTRPPPTKLMEKSRETHSLYSTAVAYLGSPDLHKELKVDIATARKLRAFVDKTSRLKLRARDEGERNFKEEAETNKKELSTILDAKQMKRFEQVYLGYMGRPYPKGALPTPFVAGYSEVAEVLKLTAEQKAKLNFRGTLDDLLDETQKKAWKQLIGEKFEGVLVETHSFRLVQPPLLAVLTTPGVAKDVKFSEAQQKQLEQIELSYWENHAKRSSGRGEIVGDYVKWLRASYAEFDQAISKVLDDRQNARLQQLHLQAVKKANLQAFLRQNAVTVGVKFDEAQQKKLAAIDDGVTRLTSLLNREYSTVARNRGAEYEKTTAAIQSNADKRREAVLNAKQKETLKKLLGEPFAGELPVVETRRLDRVGGE